MQATKRRAMQISVIIRQNNKLNIFRGVAQLVARDVWERVTDCEFD
jgi:hypothetical protein